MDDASRVLNAVQKAIQIMDIIRAPLSVSVLQLAHADVASRFNNVPHSPVPTEDQTIGDIIGEDAKVIPIAFNAPTKREADEITTALLNARYHDTANHQFGWFEGGYEESTGVAKLYISRHPRQTTTQTLASMQRKLHDAEMGLTHGDEILDILVAGALRKDVKNGNKKDTTYPDDALQEYLRGTIDDEINALNTRLSEGELHLKELKKQNARNMAVLDARDAADNKQRLAEELKAIQEAEKTARIKNPVHYNLSDAEPIVKFLEGENGVPPALSRDAAKIIAGAVRTLANTLDVRSDEALDKINADRATRQKCQTHREVGKMLLSKQNIMAAAYGIGINKVGEEPTKTHGSDVQRDKTIKENTDYLQTKTDARAVIKLLSTKVPALLPLLQASTSAIALNSKQVLKAHGRSAEEAREFLEIDPNHYKEQVATYLAAKCLPTLPGFK